MKAISDQLLGDHISLALRIARFQGNRPLSQAQVDLAQLPGSLELTGSRWTCSAAFDSVDGGLEGYLRFCLDAGSLPDGNVAVDLTFHAWSQAHYLLMPAAAYNGNRYRAVRKRYPPFLHADDIIGAAMPVTISDVPRLNIADGPSQIHLRSGDLATPAVAVFDPDRQRGCLILFEPMTAYGTTGVRFEESPDRTRATLSIEAPAVRATRYAMINPDHPSDDRGAAFAAGDRVALRLRLFLFDCPAIPDLFGFFFRHRQDMAGDTRLVHGLPWSAAYRIIEDKYNRTQYNDRYHYYRLTPKTETSVYGDWQAGWCGGGLNALALAYDGGEISQQRAKRTMDSIFGYLQNQHGYIQPSMHEGKPFGDDFDYKEAAGVLLVRKNGDILLFAARFIALLRQRGEPVPETWIAGLGYLADAFVRLWQRYGQFGQFVDIEAETILQGGTASGSVVPGGLILAWKLLEKPVYRDIAEASARCYFKQHVCQGLINGGPGEILQSPDSESASNLLESYVTLYEVTGDRQWLPMAEATAHHCASWVVSYNFIFPSQSVFGRLGMRTLGSVYANVQNKHAAPGFCTLSGAAWLRLARATGDRRYLDLIRETAHNITQYLSREDRPIASWNQGRPLPPGWMNERVNMSDWEGKDNIGGVFFGSCWSEISCLLTYAEIPGIWFLTDTGEAMALDHVNVTVMDDGQAWQLAVHNPTRFRSTVKLLAEPRSAFAQPWEIAATDHCRLIDLAPDEHLVLRIAKAIAAPYF